MKKDSLAIVRAAKRWPGWRLRPCTDGVMLYPPTGRPIAIHHAPNQRAVRNLTAQLRRAGAPL